MKPKIMNEHEKAYTLLSQSNVTTVLQLLLVEDAAED
jgi:hypothetical protein